MQEALESDKGTRITLSIKDLDLKASFHTYRIKNTISSIFKKKGFPVS